jgi:phosphoribosylformylglycinamidine synthase
VVAVASGELHQIRQEAHAVGIPTWYLGATGGDVLGLPGQDPIPLAELERIHEGWLPAYMAGEAAAEPAPEPELEAA